LRDSVTSASLEQANLGANRFGYDNTANHERRSDPLMSSTPSTARTKRVRASSAAAQPSRARRTQASTPAPASIPPASPERRHALIAEAAYRRAEKRGFRGGDPVADWLESEKEVDALLSRSAD
jgi:hypothetical protein